MIAALGHFAAAVINITGIDANASTIIPCSIW
jgi:hypothetical protein